MGHLSNQSDYIQAVNNYNNKLYWFVTPVYQKFWKFYRTFTKISFYVKN
ncbi:hypothetical protein PLAN_70440 [Planktothrix rubescens CCAP 1459/22]|uniref:Uncharacterized protein n=1 Tax=Planktothrix rubescens CCAP 1459/22 TaxID=329571 RepID=A0A6J7ZTY6_PLARU|nr:hypothetical protein PLAN_70440 [Planktothrix rubescens NIVA-CYA 18]